MRPKLPTFRAPAVDWTFMSSAALALMPISQAHPPAAFRLLSVIALFFGGVFFLYALKYYLSMALILIANGNGNGNGNGHRNGNGNGYGLKGLPRNSGDNEKLGPKPFISIHLPMYNEPAVVDRLLQSCTSLEYDDYEVIVANDSTDETTAILNQRWASHPRVKVHHRRNRSGFKGGALQEALELSDPRAEFIAVFDADFLLPPDIIQQFLSYFYGSDGRDLRAASGRPRLVDDRLAAVQGYQWHILNASENWITKGIRSEYSGSYVVERSAQELLGALKMLSGSVFMIRADLLRQHGWSGSITEDWELTLRLYLSGYKVLYTPFIQAPAECVAAFKSLVRQRMRWAEGHTYNVKKYLRRVLASPNLAIQEKLEFIYYAPYYLQSVFFLLGTGSWLISELVLKYRLPPVPATLGWALVFTNALSLLLMNLTGLFMERGVRRNWSGLLSFLLLTFMLVLPQAYAALKGLLEAREGGWHRTQKTGLITEVIGKLSLGKRFRWLRPKAKKTRGQVDLDRRLAPGGAVRPAGPGRSPARIAGPGALDGQADGGRAAETPRRRRAAPILIGLMLLIITQLGLVAASVEAAVTENTSTFWFYDDTTPLTYMMYQTQPTGTSTWTNPDTSFYSDTWQAGWQLQSGTTTVYLSVDNNTGSVQTINLTLRAGAGPTTLGTGSMSIPAAVGKYLYIVTDTDRVYESGDDGAGLPWGLKTTSFGAGPAVEITQADDGDLFIVNNSGRAYRSTDRGVNWTLRTTTGPSVAVSLASDRQNYLYVLTDTNRIYRSIDDGANWTLRTTGCCSGTPVDLTADDQSYLFVVNDATRIFRSIDGGANWTIQNTGCCAITAKAIASQKDGDLFLLNDAGRVYKSIDDGVDWTLQTTGCCGAGAEDMTSDSRASLYVAQSDGRVYKSADEGANWSLRTTGCCGGAPLSITGMLQAGKYNASFATADYTFADGERLELFVDMPSTTPPNDLSIYWDGVYNDSRLLTATVVPEALLPLLGAVPLIPWLARRHALRRAGKSAGRRGG